MSVNTRATLAALVVLVLAPLPVHAQSDDSADPGTPDPVSRVHDGTRIGLETTGVGWASFDVEATSPTSLRFELSNPAFDNLCMFNPQGFGIYDEGHYTIVHLWRLDGANPFAEEYFIWLGSPHSIMPSIQSGICGTSEPLPLEAGERARLVIATSVAGFHVDLLGADRDGPAGHRPLPLGPHPDLHTDHADSTAVVDGATTRGLATVGREWQSAFDTGPAAFYAIPWMHAEENGRLPSETAVDVGLHDWGFENATYSGPAPLVPFKRGFTEGGNVDWLAVIPGWTTGGPVTGFVRQQVVVGAYTGSVESGSWFLSVPLAATV